MRREEEIKTSLELALEEILRFDRMNVWISVVDRPITKILEEAGVRKGYSPFVLKALSKIGLIEVNGVNRHQRYMIKSQVIPDIKFLVDTIRKDYSSECAKYQNTYLLKKKALTAEANEFDKYPPSSKSDLTPPRTYSRKDAQQDLEFSPAVKVKRQVIIPNLGDMRFALKDGGIVEGKIISLHYADDRKSILYNLEIISKEWINWNSCNKNCDEDQNTIPEKYCVMIDMGVKDLFETPMEVAEYLTRHTLKYIKR
jgi:hypothetical protein